MPPTWLAEFPLTVELLKIIVALLLIPPAMLVAVFCATSELATVTEPTEPLWKLYIPPPDNAELLATVDPLSVTVPLTVSNPPPKFDDELSLIVEPVIVRVPVLLYIPPPSELEEFSLTLALFKSSMAEL